jgi:mono/diheme cytochrome c family protein
MFPPLIGTDKVLGPADTIIRILLTGLKGPLVVKGETYSQQMPPVNFLSDDEIAAILTYVRRNWGNNASKITPDSVAIVRLRIKQTINQNNKLMHTQTP